MWQIICKSVLLLTLAVVLCCGLYPLTLWSIGQLIFPFQANGSRVLADNGTSLGSLLIAQPFTKDEYFHPRPSAANYNAAASASSSLAASNYALRDRVARSLGPIVVYADGPQAGLPVAPEIDRWFAADIYRIQPHIVAQWASLHPALAQAWVKADPAHSAYIENWVKLHPMLVSQFIKENPTLPTPTATDLAVTFFQRFSEENPGKFPVTVTQTGTVIQLSDNGPEIQAIFFDMWRQENPKIPLRNLPGDMVTTSASGLDPHITLENAYYQLDRVANTLAGNLKLDPASVREKIENILQEHSSSPFGGLAGEKQVNVLEVNLELHKQFDTGTGKL